MKPNITIGEICQTYQSNFHKNQNSFFIIGICGIPGSGKSTIAQQLKAKIANSEIIPMDGYHIQLNKLSEQGKLRRGASFTFNLQVFGQHILNLRRSNINYPIGFPSFDHQQKDPIENDIKINKNTKCIIVQGLYIFDKSLYQLNNVWDIKIFIDQDKNVCQHRLIKRCIQKKIQETMEKAVQRVHNSDLRNADYVLDSSNTNFNRCFYLANSNVKQQINK